MINTVENQMGIKYQCVNNNCNYPGADRFEMTLKSESIMDVNNLAATFCPFCKKKMMACNPMDIVPDLPVTQMNE